MLLSLILTIWEEKSKHWFLGHYLQYSMLLAISVVIINCNFPNSHLSA